MKTKYIALALGAMLAGLAFTACNKDDSGDDGQSTSSAFNQNGATLSRFSVSPTKQVRFSRGNLQYRSSTNAWRFAENQYDFIAEGNRNISSAYSGWIDLFGWGTSGWNSGAVAYRPWSASETCEDYQPGGSPNTDLTGSYAEADWARHNVINNGGNSTHMWRTLTTEEWQYLFTGRSGANTKYGSATIVGSDGLSNHGVIILPDSWTQPSGVSFNIGMNGWSSNTYNLNQWKKMESAGAVFLPAGGSRYGQTVYGNSYDMWGYYWSATHHNSSKAKYLLFNEEALHADYQYDRCEGMAVRPVMDI